MVYCREVGSAEVMRAGAGALFEKRQRARWRTSMRRGDDGRVGAARQRVLRGESGDDANGVRTIVFERGDVLSRAAGMAKKVAFRRQACSEPIRCRVI